MSKKRMIIRVAIVAAVAVVIIGGIGTYLYYTGYVEPGIRMGRKVDELRMRLLCEADHQALLEACRDYSRKVMNARLKSGAHFVPEESQFPEVIRALRPRHVSCDQNGVVKIGMYTGWWPLGVYAYPEGYRKPSRGYGDRELLEGLWYYEDGYSVDPNAYDKMIDELLRKGGKLKEK